MSFAVGRPRISVQRLFLKTFLGHRRRVLFCDPREFSDKTAAPHHEATTTKTYYYYYYYYY
eukprot:612673-Heterocapsa_arctica.AAC.1